MRIRVLTDHIRAVVAHDPGVIFGPDMANGPGVIFGPDMANGEKILDAISDNPGERPHVTGLGTSHGGLGIDTHGYTAHGLGVAARVACSICDIRLGRASVQGSGAVGMHTLTELAAAGIPVVAVNNKLGTLVAHGCMGLDVSALVALLRAHGDEGLALHADRDQTARFEPRSDEASSGGSATLPQS